MWRITFTLQRAVALEEFLFHSSSAAQRTAERRTTPGRAGSILIVDAEGPRHATFRGGAEAHMFFLGGRRGPVVDAQGPDKMADCRHVAPSMGGSHQVQLPDETRRGKTPILCPLHSSFRLSATFRVRLRILIVGSLMKRYPYLHVTHHTCRTN